MLKLKDVYFSDDSFCFGGFLKDSKAPNLVLVVQDAADDLATNEDPRSKPPTSKLFK